MDAEDNQKPKRRRNFSTGDYRKMAALKAEVLLDDVHANALRWIMAEHSMTKTEAIRFAIMQVGIEGVAQASQVSEATSDR